MVKTKDAYRQAHEDAIVAIVQALRDGADPADVIPLTPFTPAYIRKIARANGVPPAKTGPKRRKAVS